MKLRVNLRAAALIGGACLASPALAQQGETLAIQGKISPQMRYRLKIDYTTTANDHACQFDDYITGMWDPKSETRYEAPAIKGGRHSLSIPLGHPGGAGACGWRPSVIAACV